MILRHYAIVAGLLLFTMSTGVQAEDKSLPDSIVSSPEQRQIDEWIRQLDSNRFAERAAASRKLQSAGEAAIDALAGSAAGGSREVTLRALDILKHHFTNGTEAEKKAALAALETLAASEHPSASARAKVALAPPTPPRPATPILLGGVQFKIQVKGKDKQRINIDQQGRHIEAEKDGRQVKIDVWNDGSIDVAVTKTEDGKQATQKYEAKNEAELKKKHPEVYKLYAEYNVAVPAIQIQVVPGALPAPPKR